jgi:hypothetical protein
MTLENLRIVSADLVVNVVGKLSKEEFQGPLYTLHGKFWSLNTPTVQ